MNRYKINNRDIDSIDLKCLVVSKGVKVSKEVYRTFSKTHRLGINPLMCNSMILSDGTTVQLTDMSFHLQYLTGILSWDNLKLLKYVSDLETPFSLKVHEGKPALFYKSEYVDVVTFPPRNKFYARKTTSGMPFIGNAVLQGMDWVSFQCLWPCEYAYAGKPCEYCFSGGEFETLARKRKPLPKPVDSKDMAEIVKYAMEECGCNSVQITGGSTYDDKKEYTLISSYLKVVNELVGRENIKGDILLYITPPKDLSVIDEYFKLGADKIACSIEVWDEELAKTVTPGKTYITTRERHLKALEYISEKYGAGKAFSNLIIGIESFETLKEGATYLAERGIIPTASIWMPMGRPVNGSMQTPGIEYYQRVKELFAELYYKYKLEPSKTKGLNVCMERDIWNYAMNVHSK